MEAFNLSQCLAQSCNLCPHFQKLALDAIVGIAGVLPCAKIIAAPGENNQRPKLIEHLCCRCVFCIRLNAQSCNLSIQRQDKPEQAAHILAVRPPGHPSNTASASVISCNRSNRTPQLTNRVRHSDLYIKRPGVARNGCFRLAHLSPLSRR